VNVAMLTEGSQSTSDMSTRALKVTSENTRRS